MASSYPHALLYILVAIHFLGLGSALLARLSEGSRRQTLCQFFFLVLMAMVAVSTAVMIRTDLTGGFLSGASLSVMVVAAVCDFRGREPSPAF